MCIGPIYAYNLWTWHKLVLRTRLSTLAVQYLVYVNYVFANNIERGNSA